MNIILLKGGLGNQLFIIAAYLFLNKKLKSKEIYLEKKIGFLLDYKYKRFYELGNLPLFIRETNFYQKLYCFTIIIFQKTIPIFLRLLRIEYINDKFLLGENFVDVINKRNKLKFIDGYFQDFSIVSEVKTELLEIIKNNISKPKRKIFENLNERIKREEDSVALCIRFYEETKSSRLHSHHQKPSKKYHEFNKIISLFERKLKAPYFFIFVQEENSFTKNLSFNSPFEYITHEKGFIGSWERMNAQSICKNHIFNNSTFYYWGAFISNEYYINKMIYVSDNFKYQNIYNNEWKKF